MQSQPTRRSEPEGEGEKDDIGTARWGKVGYNWMFKGSKEQHKLRTTSVGDNLNAHTCHLNPIAGDDQGKF